MSIEKIIYHAATWNMGEATEQDGDNYRAWAMAQIEARYPDAAIAVVDADGSNKAVTDDYDDEQACLGWLASLWDACPWTGEHFA